jgi:hypothetical protein
LDGSRCRLRCPPDDVGFGVAASDDEAVEPGDDAGAWPGPVDGCDEDVGCDDGLEEGCVGAWASGEIPGRTSAFPLCHDIPTYPPAGTVSEDALRDEYLHLPDFPSDHHSDQ